MWFDGALILLLGLGFYIGYTNGLLGIVLKIILVTIAFLLSLRLFPIIFLFLENTFPDIGIAYFIIGFLLVFGLIIFLYKFSSNKIEKWLINHAKYVSTKIIGGLVFAFFIFLICSFILGQLMRLHVLKEEQMKRSVLFPAMVVTDNEVRKLFRRANETISHAFEDNVRTINKIEKKQQVDSVIEVK